MLKKADHFILESELPQGSPEWLEWRKAGVGASEVFNLCYNSEDLGIKKSAAIKKFLGEKPPYCKTIAALAKVKMGEIVEDLSNNPHVQRGHRLEPSIRAYMAESLGVELEPVCIYDPNNPHRRVSLDAFGTDENGVGVIGEIKAPSRPEKWFGDKPIDENSVVDGENVPRMYVCQAVYQGRVTRDALGLDAVRQGFGIGQEVEGGVVCDLFPMPKLPKGFEEFVIECVDKFWSLFTAGENLEGEEDEIDMATTDDAGTWAEAAHRYRSATVAMKKAEEQKKEAEKTLKELANATGRIAASGSGVRWIRYQRSGALDYKLMMAENNISDEEAEKYRKKSSTVQRIDLVDAES